MKLFSLRLSATVGLALFGAQAGAVTWQAALKERMISEYQHPFGNDSALRVRRDVQDIGFNSFTLVTRMQMMSPTESAVFAPMVRSRKEDTQTMIESLLQGKDEIVLKPIIMDNPGFGVGNRMANINPARTDVWFDTYGSTLGLYVALALKHDISEIVVATGLHNLWKAELGERWTNLIRDVRRRVGPETRLSIELSTEDDLNAFERWMIKDKDGLTGFTDNLNVVRISVSPVEDISGSGAWDKMRTAQLITDRYNRVKALFPKVAISLANVTLPGCHEHLYREDEITCGAGAAFDKNYQASALNAFMGALATLDRDIQTGLKSIEFLEATTDREPDNWDFDPRFPYYNNLTPQIFKQQFDSLNKLLLKSDDQTTDTVRAPASQGSAAHAVLPQPGASNASPKLACVYFDHQDDNDHVGVLHARLMENLMGAFRGWTTDRRNTSLYQSGDLNNCNVAFYMGTNFLAKLPPQFLTDLSDFSRAHSVVWMNYHLPDFKKAYDVRAALSARPSLAFDASAIEQPLEQPSAAVQDPGFYRFFDYKGETFVKLAKWDMFSNRFMSSPELNIIKIADPTLAKVYATARHSINPTTTPYVVRQAGDLGGDVWYFADAPFSFVHYEDRNLILCDLMWDILGETAPTGPLGALVRIEDVNPHQNAEDLRWTIDYLTGQKVPFTLAVIPYYADVFGSGFSGESKVLKPDTDYKEFVGTMRYAKAQGAEFVWHGVYHEAGDLISGYDGVSGGDYEFWKAPENTPLPQDSSDYLLDLLEKGEAVFTQLGIRPAAWEVPHYAASALDNTFFGKLFEWNYHRSLYFWTDTVQDAPLGPQHRMFDCESVACRQERRTIARKLKINTHSLEFAGQPIPFRVWRDSYGEALIPETLGMIDYVDFPDNAWEPVSNTQDILRRAKMLRVIRGSFASFFWHPDVASPDLPYYKRHPGHYETVGGKHTLMNIITGMKEMGYQFKSIRDCSLFPSSTCLN